MCAHGHRTEPHALILSHGRIWFNEKTALDLGIGFNYNKPDGGDVLTSYIFDAGVPFIVHESGAAKFFIRPGFTYASSSSPVVADPKNKTTQFWVSGSQCSAVASMPSLDVTGKPASSMSLSASIRP